jgi:ADP-ribosylglycohydrolase
MQDERTIRAWRSLQGLALGDAFGSQFFVPGNRQAFIDQTLPGGPWEWTDDTEMAASVFTTLIEYGEIHQNALAAAFATHHDFDRGYGPGANRLLRLIREGGDWRVLSKDMFDGTGSWGNGGAMRVAPLGAWFADDLEQAAEQAARSAEVTHAHPEGIAGAVAVAVAAAIAGTGEAIAPGPFLDHVVAHVPVGLVHDGIRRAREILTIGDPATAARILGCGRDVSAQGTVPYTLWAVARHLDFYETALWTTASAGGDVDTTCAIVGGIIGTRLPGGHLPPEWSRELEPLPAWARVHAD